MQLYSFSEVQLNEENELFIKEVETTLDKLRQLPELKSVFKWMGHYPWYFLIGHQDSGKTTFIQEAEEPFLYEWFDPKKQFAIYFTKRGAFFEIAQPYLTGTQAEAIWHRLAICFRKRRIHFEGMLICISLYQLLTLPKVQRQALLNDVKRVIHSMQKTHPVPVWIIFTFLDIVNGFTEFFDDQLDIERQQSFGLEIPKGIRADELMTIFNEEFRSLLDHINQRLVRRLHNIRDENTRLLACDFPMQFEQLASLIRNVLRHLFKEELYIECLTGVYFVSGKQISNSIDRIVRPIAKQVVLSTPLVSTKKRFSRSYFIHNIVAHQLKQHQPVLLHSKELRRTLQVLVSGAALVVTLSLAYSFKRQVDQLSQIENAIQNYKHQMQFISSKNDNELIELLSAIESIDHINTSLKSFNRTWLLLPFMTHMKELKATVSKAYGEVLKRQFIPRLSLQFEAILNNMSDYSNEEVYSALKGYIMLMDKKRFDPVYVSLWFRMHWERYQNDILTAGQIKAYSDQLYSLLKQAFQPADLNHQLVFKARQHLKKLSLPKIVFLQVKNLSDHSGYHVTKVNHSEIPVIYTKQGYQKIYIPQVESVLDSFDRGDWVLGHLPDVRPGQLNAMRDQIDSLYFTQYKQWWLNALSELNHIQFNKLKDAEIFAAKHANLDNPLFNVMNALILNTKPFAGDAKSYEAFNETISRYFQSFHTMKTDVMSKLVQGFYELSRDLQIITSATDPERQAFLFVKGRFASSSGLDPISQIFSTNQKLPPIIQKPLQEYARQVWHELIGMSQKHINRQWVDRVVPFFKEKIASRYPIKPSAKDEISLQDFSEFFGYDGMLDKFFEENILPFIETDLTRWRHVVKDNLHMSFREDIIDQFERAYIIRRMFFDKKLKGPHFEFSFQPIKFDPNVSSVVIDFSGQQVYDYQGSHKITSFKWPGASGNDYMTVLMENYKGDIDTIKFKGPWALFKLIDAFNLKSTKDIEVYKVHMNATHGASDYRLIASSKINPFISNIIDRFELSDKLFELAKQ